MEDSQETDRPTYGAAILLLCEHIHMHMQVHIHARTLAHTKEAQEAHIGYSASLFTTALLSITKM